MAVRFAPKSAHTGKILLFCFALKWLTDTKNEVRIDAWKKIAKKIGS